MFHDIRYNYFFYHSYRLECSIFSIYTPISCLPLLSLLYLSSLSSMLSHIFTTFSAIFFQFYTFHCCFLCHVLHPLQCLYLHIFIFSINYFHILANLILKLCLGFLTQVKGLNYSHLYIIYTV